MVKSFIFYRCAIFFIRFVMSKLTERTATEESQTFSLMFQLKMALTHFAHLFFNFQMSKIWLSFSTTIASESP